MYDPYDSVKYPKRKNPRLQGYDYSTENYYFLTVCTWEKKCIFGQPGKLNELGEIVQRGIADIPKHFPGVHMEQFVVMPNHVHMLLYFRGEGSDLGTVIGTWKAYITREARKTNPSVKIWQGSYHDHIVRNERSFQNIWQYIYANPMNWEKDCFYTEL